MTTELLSNILQAEMHEIERDRAAIARLEAENRDLAAQVEVLKTLCKEICSKLAHFENRVENLSLAVDAQIEASRDDREFASAILDGLDFRSVNPTLPIGGAA